MCFTLQPSHYNEFGKIDFKVDEPFNNLIKEPFENSSFFYIICGPPQSGKTSLLVNMLKRQPKKENNIYYQVFSKILLVMPETSRGSISKKHNIFDLLPPDQVFDEFSIDVYDTVHVIKDIFSENEEEAKYKNKKYKSEHQLLILDDITAQLKNKDVEKMLVDLTLNRRHLKLSIILLVQVLNKIPKSVRSATTSLIFFTSKSKSQLQVIFEEFIMMDKKMFEELIKFCFDAQHNFIFINKKGDYFKNLSKIVFTNPPQSNIVFRPPPKKMRYNKKTKYKIE